MRVEYLFIVLLFICAISMSADAQEYTIQAKVYGADDNLSLPGASVLVINAKDSSKLGTTTDSTGHFIFTSLHAGKYIIHINFVGCESYEKIVALNKSFNAGNIFLYESDNMLNEVKVVEKTIAVFQKDDTTEYNADAYKVNPDADASDLIKKMPALEADGNVITAQGEIVTKVLVDGKPFFGTDAYASLQNLPADMVDIVQVYNERSEQDQFTGFSGGITTKTINIVTKADKRNGIFGKAYAGHGNDDLYTSGLSLNAFNGDRRITVTGQSDNVNVKSFGDQNLTGGPGAEVNIAKTNAIGINYSDKWGKQMDISGSYSFNEANSQAYTVTRKIFVLPIDSGQIYNDTTNAPNKNYNHRFNLRLYYVIDTMNSILFTPQLALQQTILNSSEYGITEQGTELINETLNNNLSKKLSYNLSGSLLYKHRFYKKGRTFSLNITGDNNHNNGITFHTAQNIYYSDTALYNGINQQNILVQNSPNISATAIYTEPINKRGLLDIQYSISYLPAISRANTFDYSSLYNNYLIADTPLSNTFTSRNIMHKAGASYQYNAKQCDFSIGLYYQLTQLICDQQLPYSFVLSRNFENVLPTITFSYKFSKSKNLRFSYITAIQTPGVTQLQNVINNSNPLQLTTGNPNLKQPYQNSFSLQYNATNTVNSTIFSASASGTLTQNNITNESIIPFDDTVIQHIVLPKGSQLTMPVNINGNESINLYAAYGLPLKFIRSRLKLNMTVMFFHSPSIINNEINFQNNRTGGMGISLVSNVNENVDFTISSNIDISSNNNSLNTSINNIFISQNDKILLNLIFCNGFIFNTGVSYEYNSGLSNGYNQGYTLWNMSVGKKIFKNRQGDFRLVAHDILSDYKNIQQTITNTYIQDTKSNVLTRYFMLVFTYKIKNFKL